METAKENKLNPYEYFKYLFELLPNVDISDVKVVDTLLPWSDNLPEICKTQLNTNNDNDKPTT